MHCIVVLCNVISILLIIKYMKNNEIKEWLSLNDNEIGILQNFVIEYVKENEIDKEKSFMLGVLSSEIQFYMRCMKELIYSNETKYIKDVSDFIKAINLFKGLCVFTKNKLIEYYKQMPIEKQYEYLRKDEYKTSFFNRNNDENQKIANDDWDIIYRRIKKLI